MEVYRNIKKHIDFYLTKYPIIALTGPRQSGKTTLLRTHFPDFKYVNMENPEVQEFAETDPAGFLQQHSDKTIFDEVQRTPLLFRYLQVTVDAKKEMGNFILCGSQNFQLLENITQSLAGRVSLFTLLPFDNLELQQAGLLPANYFELILNGSYPPVYDRQIPTKNFYSNYIQTYIERDVSLILNIKDKNTFRKFLTLCAGRSGQLLNLNSLANDCGISQPTAKAWLSVLESSYILFRLQPYFDNLNKRVIKSEKIYFYDTGLLSFLIKLTDPEVITSSSYKGMLFENLMVSEAMKQNYHRNLGKEYWFYRDSNQLEVDLLCEENNQFELFELKASQTIFQDAFKAMSKLEPSLSSSKVTKSLIYGGNEKQTRNYGKVVPWREAFLE